MCRLLYFSGSKDTIDLAYDFIEALKKASEKDKTCPFSPPEHRNGFGYVIAGEKEGSQKIYFSKNYKPIFEEVKEIQYMKEITSQFDNFCLSLHSRRASNSNVSLFNAHPYFFSTNDGLSFFLSHNGSLKIDKIISYCGIEAKSSLSDTYFLGLAIEKYLKEVNESSLTRLFRDFKKLVKEKSALNTISLFMDSGDDKTSVNKISMFLTNYYNCEAMENYYKIFVSKENEGFFVFASSGLIDYLDECVKEKLTLIENNTYIFIEDAITAKKIVFKKL
jgi:predicted glutamine amidotransferase